MGLADVGGGCWERICERIAAQLPRWGETRRDGCDDTDGETPAKNAPGQENREKAPAKKTAAKK